MKVVAAPAGFDTAGWMTAFDPVAASEFTCQPGSMLLCLTIDDAAGRLPQPSIYVALETNGTGRSCWLDPGTARAAAAELNELADLVEHGASSGSVQ